MLRYDCMEKSIKKMINLAKTNPHGVYFLNTQQELKNFYLEGLDKYTTWKAIASIEDWLPVDKSFLQDFRKKLDENKIKTRVIFKESDLRFEPSGLKYRKVKVIPPSYEFQSSIDILDDKLLIMNPDLNVLGLVVEIDSILDIFNDVFDLLWDTLPDPAHKKV